MTGFTPETEACLACHPSQKDAGTMTDKTVDEAVERVRGYVESWDGFDDGTIISDELGPNPLTLGDLRALLSALELGRQAQQSPAGLGLHPSALQEPSAPEFNTDIGWRLIDKGAGDDWQALGLFPEAPPFHLTIYDGRQNDMTVGPLTAREADKLGRRLIAIAALSPTTLGEEK